MFAGIISFFLSPIGKLISYALLATSILGGIYAKGHWDGSAAMKAKWDAAIAADIAENNRARAQAEKEIGADPKGAENDPLNRDKW